jgi:ribonuclease BN (tRNA processing enzyme)/isopentenyl phosphate kinase
MEKTETMLIKLGGSLITYKQDQKRINDYLRQIDLFMTGKGSENELKQNIRELTNFKQLNQMFRVLSSYLTRNPKRKIVLINGAGSIGHSLVLHVTKNQTNLQETFPIVKLAVSIQNQIVVATAIQNGIKAISFPSHPILIGKVSTEVSSKKADSPDLSVFEKIITESDAVPILYGDVGYTSSGWKVFSGDIYPSAIIRRQNRTQLTTAIFLTYVKGKKTGIYTKDPNFPDAEFISRIEADITEPIFYNSNGNVLKFESGKLQGNFDVTDAMTGKLRNLVELANSNVRCLVVGPSEFENALYGYEVGTRIVPKRNFSINTVFLGTGDAFGSNGLKSASILIEKNNQGILLDCGPHTLSMLKKQGRNTNDIDLILITHFHGDHLAGLPFILLDANLQQQRTAPLVILGPQGIEDKVNKLFSALYGNLAQQELSFQCKFIPISPNNPIEIHNFNIEAIKTLHTPESQGYRIITKDITLAYSGDTGWTDALFKLVENSNLSIVECNFFDSQFDNHLNYNEVVKLRFSTERLALIHLGSEALNRIPALDIDSNIFIPYEGQEVQI